MFGLILGVLCPLVIDGKVTTDTINILDLLATRFGATKQCFYTTQEEKPLVNFWVDKAASLFIEALTYGHIDGVKSPFLGNASDSGRSHQDKVDLLSGLIETYKKDPTLKTAYEKKRAVIEATKEAMVSPGQMSAIVDATRFELSIWPSINVRAVCRWRMACERCL